MQIEPTTVYRQNDGTLATEDGQEVTCSWFAACVRPAVDVEPHPVLGGVPICEPCKNKVANLK